MKADVVVVGGGPAGTACARAAAERGASVILVERYGFLGGNLTAALVGTIGGLFVKGAEGFDYVVGGIPRDCAETLKGRGQAYGPIPWENTAVLPYLPFGLKMLLDEWMERAGVRLHLHTRLTRVNRQGERIESIRVANKGGSTDIEGTVFVDASGDGDLAFLVGASMEGSPVQFPSMNFYMANVNIAEALTAGLATLQTLIKEAMASGEYDLPRAGGAVIPTMRPGEIIVAMGRIAKDGRPVDCADPLELVYAEKEGRRQALQLAAFLKARMPGFAEAYVSDTPTQVGVRATRRLVGKYVLTAQDVLGGASFKDAVCRVCLAGGVACRGGKGRRWSSCRMVNITRFPTAPFFPWRWTTSWWPGAASPPASRGTLRPGSLPPAWPWGKRRAWRRSWPWVRMVAART